MCCEADIRFFVESMHRRSNDGFFLVRMRERVLAMILICRVQVGGDTSAPSRGKPLGL